MPPATAIFGTKALPQENSKEVHTMSDKIESLKEGQKLQAIFWSNGGVLYIGNSDEHAKSITVYFEPGQMANVPWAYAEINDGSICRFNLHLCEGVRELNEEKK